MLLHTKYTSFRLCGFRKDDFFISCFSYNKPLVDADARGLAYLVSRGMLGSINKGDS